MKFLFDQSADFRLIPHLRQLGHDVQAVSRNYPPGLPDEDVLKIARKEQRILIVADRDFGELIFHQGLAHAGVIFFRLPGAKLQTKIEQLNTVLAEHTDDLALGEFLVVTPRADSHCRSSACLEPFLEARGPSQIRIHV
jgi:predicted nuclease of predicted toxin-antitoxin system